MAITQELKSKIEKQNFTQAVKDISRDARNLKKLEVNLKSANPKDTEILKNYQLALQEKIAMVLNSIDEKKAGNANLAQLTKALRILSENLTKANTGVDKVVEHRSVQINIDLDKMSKDDLMDLLNKKSRQLDT